MKAMIHVIILEIHTWKSDCFNMKALLFLVMTLLNPVHYGT